MDVRGCQLRSRSSMFSTQTKYSAGTSHLSERESMRRQVMQIGGLLKGREAAARIREVEFWLERAGEE